MRGSHEHSPLRVIVPLGFALALSLGGDATLYTVLPSEPAVAGITVGLVGWVLGLNRAIRVVLNPLVGILYDRGPRRRLFVLAMGLGTFSTGLYLVADGAPLLIIGRLIWGTAWALLLVGGYAIVLDVTTPANRGRYTGLFQAWYFVGGALGVALGGIFKDMVGYRTTLLICCGLTGLGTIVAAMLLPETGTAPRRTRAGNGLARPTLASLRAIDRDILVADYINFVHFFVGNGVLFSTVGLALSRWSTSRPAFLGALGIASLTGLLLAARALLTMIVAPAAGAFSDGGRGRWRVIGLGTGVMLAGFAMLTLTGSIPSLVAATIVISLGGGIMAPALTALMGDLAPAEREGLAMGTFATAADVGSAAGPILAYSLATSFALAHAYALCVVLLLTVLVVLWAVRSADRRPVPAAEP